MVRESQYAYMNTLCVLALVLSYPILVLSLFLFYALCILVGKDHTRIHIRIDFLRRIVYLVFSGNPPHEDPQMTIQTIAQKQLDQPTTIYFARKGTSDCYWFNLGVVMSYSDYDAPARRVSLDLTELAATDWRVIRVGFSAYK